jgi:hypothetical protein
MTRNECTERILAAKQAKGLTWQQIDRVEQFLSRRFEGQR